MAGKVLIVDDDPNVQYTLREALRANGFEPTCAANAPTALGRLRDEPFDAVLLDVMLEPEGGMDGMEALGAILRIDANMPVVLMTAYGSRELALRAIQRGAFDFFEKPFQIEELAVVVRRAVERRVLIREAGALAGGPSPQFSIERLIGQSPAMQPVREALTTVFANDVTVLLLGENGTGKTLLARMVHENSSRRGGPFVTVTCASVPETLLESELFGYEPGAFTGAIGRKQGRLESANSGTIFLDEIGDLSAATQAKLLRVLDQRECERLGGTKTVQLDVRIVTATNKDLSGAVAQGTFRSDLYYRLNVFPITLPPLRERREDIAPLAAHFVELYARKYRRTVTGCSPEAQALLAAYRWPGNVRELEHAIESAVLRAKGSLIEPSCLPPEVVSFKPRAPERAELAEGQGLDDMLAAIERSTIEDALRHTGGVQSRAAKLLGISERSLWHRIRKHGIDVDGIKDAPLPRP